MQNKQPNIYPDGMYIKKIEIEKAPRIKASISIRPEQAYEFMKKNVNSRGYCKLDVIEGDKDWYLKLNTWEKEQIATRTTQTIDDVVNDMESGIVKADVNASHDDIPF